MAIIGASYQLAEGNFNVTLPASSHDEMGDLARAFDEMRRSMLKAQKTLAQKAVEASDNATRFQTVLESMPAALVIIDKNGCIIEFNWMAEKIFDYRCHEMMGQKFSQLVPTEQQTPSK